VAAEVTLVGIASVVLEEGVKFLYAQAGEVLKAWRARRADPVAPGPVMSIPPAGVTVGTVKSSRQEADLVTIDALAELRDDVQRHAADLDGLEAVATRRKIADLRDFLEAALGTTIRFDGEPPRSTQIAGVSVLAREVTGRVVGVALSDGTVRDVRVQSEDVGPGGEVIGVKQT
jgi:hypothetical protein